MRLATQIRFVLHAIKETYRVSYELCGSRLLAALRTAYTWPFMATGMKVLYEMDLQQLDDGGGS